MDDLLIVRASDRVRVRPSQRRAQVPIGANFGLIAGAALGLVLSTRYFPSIPYSPFIGVAFGIATGIALGGLFGRFLRPATMRRRKSRPDLYDGLPFTDPESEE